MKGELSLTRSHQEDRDVSLRLRLDTGRTMTMTMKLADFGLLITGMSDVPCEIELRNVELIVAPRGTKLDKADEHAQALRDAALGNG